MDIKEEVRRRITELTRFAYERGYRDGAQSALAEIESIATDDIADQLTGVQAPLEAIAETEADGNLDQKEKSKAINSKRSSNKQRPRKVKAKRSVDSQDKSKPKTLIVKEALQTLLDANGQALRDEVLSVAQKTNPAITKFDLGNGLRSLVKQSKVRVSPDDNSMLLPI